MFEKTKSFLHETKSKIGLVHGFTGCIGAVLLSFLTSRVISILINDDYAIKIFYLQ